MTKEEAEQHKQLGKYGVRSFESFCEKEQHA